MSDNKKQYKDIIIKGSAKKVEFSNGGHLFNFDIKMTQLTKILDWLNEERKKRDLPETEYLRLTLRERKSVDDWGNTHYVSFEPWFPEKKVTNAAPKAENAEGAAAKADDDLPW